MEIVLIVLVLCLLIDRRFTRLKYNSIRDYVFFNSVVVNRLLTKKNILNNDEVVILVNEIVSELDQKEFRRIEKSISRLGVKIPNFMNQKNLIHKINNLKYKNLLDILDSVDTNKS